MIIYFISFSNLTYLFTAFLNYDYIIKYYSINADYLEEKEKQQNKKNSLVEIPYDQQTHNKY